MRGTSSAPTSIKDAARAEIFKAIKSFVGSVRLTLRGAL